MDQSHNRASEIIERDHHVDVPDGRVFVRQWSPVRSERSSPLVLLHDSIGCVATWRKFPAALASRLGRPIYAYDRVGYGQSSALSDVPRGDYIRNEAVRNFPELMRNLGLDSCTLMGHSAGGAIAICIASEYPADCQAVISESTQTFVEDHTRRGIEAAKQRFREPGEMSRLAKYHGEKAQWVLEAWTKLWLSDEFANWNLFTELSRVKCPILALHGAQDEYGSNRFPRSICECAGGPSKLSILENCGHIPHREREEIVLSRIETFLEQVDNNPAEELDE